MERNHNIDVLKALCALLVVILHGMIWGKDYVVPITRCAVPCFLIISGWFLYNEDKQKMRDRIKKSIRRITMLLLWSTSVFAVVKLTLSLRTHDFSYLSFDALWKFVVFNENPFGFHLWYLGAYLYALVVVLYLCKCKRLKALAALTPPLLLTDLFLGKYSLLLLGYEPPYIYVRNFLFVGLPYLTIGLYLKRYSRMILSHHNIKTFSAIGVILFSVSTLAEKWFLVSQGCNATRDHYLSTTFLAISLFLLFVTTESTKENWMSKIGKTESLYIYIFHPLFLIFFTTVNGHLPSVWNTIYTYAAPIIVFLLTIVFCNSLRKLRIIK